MVVNFTSYIISEDEKKILLELETEDEFEKFLKSFWKKRDPTPSTDENKFKDNYVVKFTYANLYLGGWQSDQARVYILYGPPTEKIFLPLKSIIFENCEIWVYDKPLPMPEIPNIFMAIGENKMKFVFADRIGFGYKEQIYSTENSEKVDARVYRIIDKF